jgi:hypothetical protein
MLNFYFGAGEAVLFGQSDCLTAPRLKNACGIHGFPLILMIYTNGNYHSDSLQAQVQLAVGKRYVPITGATPLTANEKLTLGVSPARNEHLCEPIHHLDR